MNSKWIGQVFFMELRKLITYRADFWVNFFGLTFFSLTLAYFLWESIFSYTDQNEMSGFTLNQMIFYYLVTPLVFRIQQGQNIGFLSREIYDGTLNKYLLYPIDVYKYKLATYLAHSTFFTLQLIFIVFCYHLFMGENSVYSFELFPFLGFLISLIIASMTFFYMFTLAELLAFWFDNIWSLGVMLRFSSSFFGGALIPLAFFPQWAQEFLNFTPFPYLISFPYETLIGELSLSQFCLQCLISLVWLLMFRQVSLLIWRKGQYQYTGVGI
ncbi:MAG: hypothetical protein CME62_11395 [Halobacteriovoraceae bacterium]|nr:hypothetical protein [Halobacteriovoraceae bacterium]|tara:strand:+ start:24181 stop:24990 length:810 start_codon:yes stop_codon:yes gene_type:complete